MIKIYRFISFIDNYAYFYCLYPLEELDYMTHALDHTDSAILNLLQDDATLPLKTIAEKVHVSIATAQRRVQALIDDECKL